VIDFHVITIFPEIFSGFSEASLIGKARASGLINLNLIDLREFTRDRHRMVDDSPYGGGFGMVMKPEPIFECLDALPAAAHKVLLAPSGRPFVQSTARRFSQLSSMALFCGRYEGLDERAAEQFDEVVSIGDYVLNGGEVASMVIIEAVARLIPGVIGKMGSVEDESFSAGLLEYPQYTRPEVYREQNVPPILLSGDHLKIAAWRRAQSLIRTKKRRPDLLDGVELTQSDRKTLDDVE